MNRPIRTTIVFALVSGVLVVAAAWLLQRILDWPLAFKLALWAELAVYSVLLARWSGTAPVRILFPLSILLGVAVWPQSHSGFFIMALAMLSWVRSGICFRGVPLRACMAEGFCLAGAGMLLWVLGGSTSAGWALNISLFFLVQSLYFFIIPERQSVQAQKANFDPFERAMADAGKVLE